jgi:hypothetical protein
MKKLFKILVGPVEVMCWFRWKEGFNLLGVYWGVGFSFELCNLTIDVQKRDEEF